MKLPDGVTLPASSEITAAYKRIRLAMTKLPAATKANHLLSDSGVESHRIFISTFIQHSTYAHFALGDRLAGRIGAWSKGDDWTRVRIKALSSYFGIGVKDFAFDYYCATQHLLRSSESLELFRAIPRDTAQLLFDDLARPGLKARLYLNVLSSWSDQFQLPERFAMRSGGAVLRINVPIHMVFAYWRVDDLMEFILRRQCQQHLKSDPDTLGGEAIVWCPLRCIEVRQQDIAADFTQVAPKGSF